MRHKELLDRLNRETEWAMGMGGPEKLNKRRAQGNMNARERIDYLFDEDSFTESGLFAKAIRPEVQDKSPADAKIAGYGKIDGRKASIVSNDFTVLGASSSTINLKKVAHMKKTASKRGFPLILLGESTGARVPDRMGAAGRAIIGSDPTEYLRDRKVPFVSALLGPCYGSSTWYSCISDFVVMRKGAAMSVASSRVTSIAISRSIDAEELGGWELHSEITGLADVVVDTDEEALDVIKRYLSYMPSNNKENPPEYPVSEGSGADSDKILDILPESQKEVYNVKDIIKLIVDKESFFELKPSFGEAVVTAFARLDGKTVGILANNPYIKGGAIDVDACRKATSFLVHCDSFNVPIVFMADQPGFLIGLEGEKKSMPGLIMNWMNALQLVTVPKIKVILRKDYGQEYLNMGGGRNSDETILWPTANLGFMDPSVAVNILYNVREEDDPERYKELFNEVQKDTGPWDLAAFYEGHKIIDPRDTRDTLIRLLEVHRAEKDVGQHLLSNWPTSF